MGLFFAKSIVTFKYKVTMEGKLYGKQNVSSQQENRS